MPIWQLGADVTGFVQGMGSVAAAVGAQNKAIQQMTVVMTEANAAATKFQQTVKGVATDGSNITAKFNQYPGSGNTYFKGLTFKPPTPPTANQDEEKNGSNGGILSRLPQIASVTLLRTGIHAVINEIKAGVIEAVKFETEISRIRTVSQSANVSFVEWATTIRGISDAFGQSQTDVAQAAIKALSSQLVTSKNDVKQFVGTASQFSEIVGGTAVQGTEALTSAIRAFGLSANDAQSTAEKLFAVYRNSGASIQEIATAYKQGGAVAHAAGLDIDSFSAAITTFTAKGVPFNEAASTMTEILTSLIKPSKEMKDLFAQLGVASVDVLFATYGFEGGLKKLTEASHGSSTELATLLGRLRGLKGETGLLLFKDFDENLQKIKGSAGEYAEAAKLIIESPGKQIKDELNKIHNYFVDGLGVKTLEVITNVSQGLGGFANVIKIGTDSLATYAIAIGTYRVSVFLATQATQAYSTAVGYSSIALHSAIPFVGIAIASYTAMAFWLNQASDGGERLRKALELVDNKKVKNRDLIDTSSVAKYKTDVETVFTAVEKTLAGSFINANNRVNTLRDTTRELGRDLDVAFSTAVHSMDEGLRGISKRIAETESEIKKSSKSTVDFRRSLEDSLRQEQNKYATPQQKIGFNNQYIKELQDEISKAYATNDKDEIDSARKKFDEIAKLERENFQTQVEIAKQGGGYIGVSIQSLKYQYQDLAAKREQYEAQYRANLRASLTDLNAIDAKERERLKAVQNAIKEFNEVQKKATEGTFDKNKTDDKQFFNGDKLDLEKVRAFLKERALLIANGAGQSGLELIKIFKGVDDAQYNNAKQLQAQKITLEKDTATQTANIYATMFAKITQDAISEKQKEVAETRRLAIATAAEFTTAQKNLTESLTGKGPGLGELKTVLDGIKDIIDEAGSGNGAIRQNVTDAADRAKKAWEEFEKARQNAVAAAGESLKTPEGLEKLDSKLKLAEQKAAILKATLIELGRASSKDPNANEFQLQAKGRFLSSYTDAVAEQLNSTKKVTDKAKKATAALVTNGEEAANIIREATGALSEALGTQLTAGGANADSTLKTTFSNISQYIKDATADASNFNSVIDNLRLHGVLLSIDKSGPALPNADAPIAQAGGGYLWGPRGGDNIPAWLTKGEFVMNAQATDMYRPILESMNQSKRPGYYNSGGYVTTNVGDININYTSTGKAETDVRKIGNLLQREIKRGNVKLR